MESVASFLNATELGAMKQGIDQILTSVNSQNQDLSKKVADGVKAEAELNSQIAALKSKIDAVPEKLKKKLGWIG